MRKYKLSLDPIDEKSFTNLIAVHCQLEGFKLVYLLNDKLNMTLKRIKKDFIPYKEKDMAFMYFEWTQNHRGLSLFYNKQKAPVKSTQEELFTETFFCENYLFPEHHQVDYFIKTMEGEEEKTLSKIKEIKEIKMTYIINSNRIKSKSILAII